MQSRLFYAVPYVPGCVQGRATRDIAGVTQTDILVIKQQDLHKLQDCRPAALVIIDGAPFSHQTIQFMHMNVPIVIAGATEAAQIRDGGYLQVNGLNGEVLQIEALGEVQCPMPPRPDGQGAVLSKDGKKVYLRCSISHVRAASDAVKFGGSAIGLVRSEMFYPSHGQVPDSDFFLQVFSAICQAARPLSVTIRLLDIAPDKRPPWLDGVLDKQGPLGLQGSRLYENDRVRQVLLAQLAAINQLASECAVRLIIPNVTSLDEFQHWHAIIRDHVGTQLAVGAMAENPAAVLDIGRWLQAVDFVAIGTNDLMQCLFAADRDLPALRGYLNPYTPILYRLLNRVAADAGPGLERIQICGLFAQLAGVLPVLLGMGYRNFSVEPNHIPYLARTIAITDLGKAKQLVEKVCMARNSSEVYPLLDVHPLAIWS